MLVTSRSSKNKETMVFNAISHKCYFSYIAATSAPTYAFLEFSLPLLSTIFFPSHWLLYHITIAETMDSGERGMNPVTMTIINPQTECWLSPGSNQVLYATD